MKDQVYQNEVQQPTPQEADLFHLTQKKWAPT